MVPPDPNQADDYVQKDPSKILLSNIPERSMQTVSFIFPLEDLNLNSHRFSRSKK